jgi:hypothetical protein
MTYDEFVAIAMEYPGVEQSTSYGTPAVKVRGKLLARLREPDVLVLRVFDEFEKQMLIDTQPEAFFITPHYEGYPAQLVRLSVADIEQVRDLTELAWRVLASARAVKAFDAARAR